MTDDRAGAETIEAAQPRADFLGGQKLEDGIGLCLSGGGFRAMLFHLGAFIRLNELGLLAKLDRSRERFRRVNRRRCACRGVERPEV